MLATHDDRASAHRTSSSRSIAGMATIRSSGVTNHPGSLPPLPHLAYIEALADTPEGSERWHSVTAGYAVLQLFEAWVASNCGEVALSAIEMRRVRKRLEAVSERDPMRRCLTHLVDVLVSDAPLAGTDERRLRGFRVGRLMAAYGKLLQYEASWALSRDVYQTLINSAHCVDDDERLLDSMLMVGFCHRMLSALDEARDAYGLLRATAAELGSQQYLLMSELGFAKIAMERGNLPAAAGMLDQIITETQAIDHIAIRAKALMDRARVAGQLGDLTTAASLNHQALECSNDPMERDRILVNIGMTLMLLGLWDQARDANLILIATAQEASMQWLAKINLMELAYFERREPTFEHYRREVAELQLPPYLEAVYHETCARGYLVFGRPTDSRVAFVRMLAVAENHGLNEFIIKAESALNDSSRVKEESVVSPRSHVGEQPPEIAAVAHAITEMRILAGL
jgi:tetratricopeptide (TPR) repeat protein